MATRLSRRALADHAAAQLLAGNTTVMAQLAAYLIETHRTDEVDLLVRDIESALARSGVVIADIASARELTDALKKAVVAYVSKATGAKDVQVRTHVDASLIGGARVRTPDAEYDATVRRQLMKLQAMKV